MSVVTRFAPSPTGFLHIGGCRTALFNWLYARHHGGRFLLRIEDTDRKRSTPEAIAAILDGLRWLGLDWDGEEVYQSERAERHAAVARALVEAGKAYHCYCSPEELEEMRQKARAEGRSAFYDRRWRDRDPADAPADVEPVVRIRAPLDGETAIEDGVQGRVALANQQLDDMVLLRADGTPTYMLSVVVDDHDMGVSQVIRGDDHLTNAFRQTVLYRAMDWAPPAFAHIPLIHGDDGAKLSKRHGALGIEAYREMGYLPEAMRNYLLRLGWSHGDDEFISTEEAIAWFDLDGIGRSPSRFDMAKLNNVNAHYLKEADDDRLAGLICDGPGTAIDEGARARLTAAIPILKPRAKTLVELSDAAGFLLARPSTLTPKAAKILDPAARDLLVQLAAGLAASETWDEAALEGVVRAFAEVQGVKLGAVAQPLRAALTGSHASPGIFEVMALLGREESLARLAAPPAGEA
ncbi:MAG: glutamate--tRNA ligase [Kiloniellales bacterium]|nr:glutamate--tRNA ligase [Kiloniellales bacterium]